MISASNLAGSCRKRLLFSVIPAVSAPDYDETVRKNIWKMEAVFPPEFFRTETVSVRVFPVTAKKTEPLIPRRITIGISQYPSGIDQKQKHIPEPTSHPRVSLAFHQGFPRDFTRVSLGFH
jgi:hypothetical protein